MKLQTRIQVPGPPYELSKFEALSLSFPCVQHIAGLYPWNAEIFEQSLKAASHGERICGAFLLMVWRGDEEAAVRFSLVEAVQVLDESDRNIIAGWVDNPFFP